MDKDKLIAAAPQEPTRDIPKLVEAILNMKPDIDPVTSVTLANALKHIGIDCKTTGALRIALLGLLASLREAQLTAERLKDSTNGVTEE